MPVHLNNLEQQVISEAITMYEESLRKHRTLTVPGLVSEEQIDKKLEAIISIRERFSRL